MSRSVLQEFMENDGGRWLPELEYVIYEKASEASMGTYTRDKGNDGKMLQDFWTEQPGLRKSNIFGFRNELSLAEIAILRVFTGPWQAAINFFLRNLPVDHDPMIEYNGTVMRCENVEYTSKTFVETNVGDANCARCGKPRQYHFAQKVDDWKTSAHALRTGIMKLEEYTGSGEVYCGFADAPLSLETLRNSTETLAEKSTLSLSRRTIAGASNDEKVHQLCIKLSGTLHSAGADIRFLSQCADEHEVLLRSGSFISYVGELDGRRKMHLVEVTRRVDYSLYDLDHITRTPEDSNDAIFTPSDFEYELRAWRDVLSTREKEMLDRLTLWFDGAEGNRFELLSSATAAPAAVDDVRLDAVISHLHRRFLYRCVGVQVFIRNRSKSIVQQMIFSLAHRIAETLPACRPHIETGIQRIETATNILRDDFYDQKQSMIPIDLFRELVLTPLTAIPPPKRTMLIIIHQIDQAKEHNKLEMLLLSEDFKSLPAWLRVLVSWNDPDKFDPEFGRKFLASNDRRFRSFSRR